jgi:hypothetical protein
MHKLTITFYGMVFQYCCLFRCICTILWEFIHHISDLLVVYNTLATFKFDDCIDMPKHVVEKGHTFKHSFINLLSIQIIHF